MKLNTKRVILVGFAFFLISAFWQAYDAIVPLMLVNKFGLNQTWSGIIMALDNLLALFLLPLFGALSDKTKSKIGKRKIYILVGTIIAVTCFVGLTFADNAQLKEIDNGTNHTYWAENYEISNSQFDCYTNNDVAEDYTVKDYASQINYNKNFDKLTADEQAQVEEWFADLSTTNSSTYSYDKTTNTYTLSNSGYSNAYSDIVLPAHNCYAHSVTQGQYLVLIIFVALLLITLLGMSTFRSPAVALMPDVTVKPLRSKGNAIINLMGTAGGILVLVLGILFGTGKIANQTMSYTPYVLAVGSIMIVALIIFMLLVKENKWNQEMLDTQAELDAEDNTEVAADTNTNAEQSLPKEKIKSLLLILASVALWFTGYNAITTKYSLYAVNVIEQDFNTTLLIAQAAAILSYIPVGMLASKIGRKKSILIGIALLTVAFAGGALITKNSPSILMWLLFALAGIAWATINVNSFPMVVELSQGGTIGKYTGYYYTASMSAQIITPLLSGLLMDSLGTMKILFPYGALFVALSFVTMLLVKHGDIKPLAPKSKLEMLGDCDD